MFHSSQIPAEFQHWVREIGSCKRVTISAVEHHPSPSLRQMNRTLSLAAALVLISISFGAGQKPSDTDVPPRVAQVHRFLAPRRGLRASQLLQARPLSALVAPRAADASTAVWQPLGPNAVVTQHYGLITGRVSSIAIDPSDATGNRVLIGTTGGGVWASQNAGSSSSVLFTPLTDTPSVLSIQRAASISIGAITIQPGGAGVILAGTGDPNDALDSYYGTGVLRSTDNGNSWTLIRQTSDKRFSFEGEGFAGFAWSTTNPQLVVAAVAQSFEGTLVNAPLPGASSAGLFYSTDAGATWSLATISDAPDQDVQGPTDTFTQPNGNSATAVVWNAARGIFVAAVRFHGYYQSTDGITWTRMPNQPGAGLTTRMCPSNPGMIGSIACPIFRGALAVNPSTGDTIAWTVDLYNQDQGIWQDVCGLSGNACSNHTITFSKKWDTKPLETNNSQGPLTIVNGDYNLVLAAVPSQQDTLLLAGANDLWKCSLAVGCVWRNTTNANSCMSAAVAPYQHALAWNTVNPQQIFIGNDSGLWRSTDAINETGSVCSSDDTSHFQNLNYALGSLAEVESMSNVVDSSYTMMAGLGANGTAGIKGGNGPSLNWPQIFTGEGGPVAIDPLDSSNWYVNSSAGVSIYRCSQSGSCSPSDFGITPVVDFADLSGDSLTMTQPAPFLVDPLDHTQLLIGTCRMWRGPADGTAWSAANAISTMLDGIQGQSYCSGDAMIRTIAAFPIASDREVIYVGMYGAVDGGSILGGHVLKTTYDSGASSLAGWEDLALNPVQNPSSSFNAYGYDISSIYIDPHDATGNTAYVTVAAIQDPHHPIRLLYRTTDGGAHWIDLTSNLPISPANGVVIDPQDPNTAYVATDIGVYATNAIATCSTAASNCWSVFGTGLPYAPVVQLSTAPAGVSPSVLVAGTYGRGIWQIPLGSAGIQLTTASVDPGSLAFSAQTVGTQSAAQTITVSNTGGIALTISAVSASADFSETDDCVEVPLNTSGACSIQVSFEPSHTGTIAGQIMISGNLAGGEIAIPVSGTALSQGPVNVSPGTLDFGQVQIGTSSNALSISVENTTSSAVAVTNLQVTAPYQLAGNACGSSLRPNSECQLSLTFTPTQAGKANGTFTLTDAFGSQTANLTGTGMTAPTDTISPTSLSFAETPVGALSSPQILTLTNNGDLPLKGISVDASAGFQVTSNCGATLSAHTMCSISVLFAPTAIGNISGTARIADSDRTQTVALAGVGVSAPFLNVIPSQISFPAQLLGTTSASIPVTITNKGGASLAGLGFQLIGQNSSSFGWNASSCGRTLNAAETCTATVTFTPATNGQLNAVLVVSSSTRGVDPVQVSLTGLGQAASGISIAPNTLSFTQSTIGQPSAQQTVTISNTSSSVATALVFSIAPPFSIAQSTCGSSLAAGTTCTTAIIFTPVGNGTVSGTLNVTSSAFTNPATLVLTGIGGAAGSLLSQPPTLNFPPTGVAVTSASQTVTLTNNGPLALTSFSALVSDGFRVASSTCGSTLELGASCTVQVAFAPATAGQKSGTLTVSSPSLASTKQVALSGMGTDFSLAASGQSSQSIASGQAATYMLTLAPLNGSSGTFTFACTSLPANSSCTFNPTTETISPNTSATVTVKIATGQSSASAFNLHQSALVPGFFCILFLLPFARRRGRRVFMLLSLLIGTTFATTSCAGAGGGGGGTPGGGSSNNNTPAGTYSVVATATSNGVAHKITLTLTVD